VLALADAVEAPRQSLEGPRGGEEEAAMAVLTDYRTADPYEAAAIRCAEASEQLWALTAEERIAAMRRGELSLNQLCEWARRRPDEVPALNGEFEFIAVTTPEVIEAA